MKGGEEVVVLLLGVFSVAYLLSCKQAGIINMSLVIK
jgi:hypothetical protein